MQQAINPILDKGSASVQRAPEKSTTVALDVSAFDYSEYGINAKQLADNKIITLIEKTVRASPEYRRYINYLKENLNLNSCALMPGLNSDDMDISIEFHHYPFTLYDICKVVAASMFDDTSHSDDLTFSAFQIAERVMNEHYCGNVGLVPLSTTMHELAHSGGIVIPLSKVNGNFADFYIKYHKYITDDLESKVELAKSCTDADAIESINKAKLDKNIIRLKIRYGNDDFSEVDDEDKA